MAKLISKTYGEALFELAVEQNRVDTFLEEVKGICKILKEYPDLDRLMNHPKIMKEEKAGILENIFKGRLCDELTGFITLIVKKDRYHDISAILHYFLERVRELKGIGVASVTTAVSLDEDQKRKIKARLLETTKFNEMEISYIQDASVIGGMLIRIGDRVVDSTIQTKLDEMKKQLMNLQLT